MTNYTRYELKVVGKIRYHERKDGDEYKSNTFELDSDQVASLLVDLAGGGYTSSQVRKAMIYNADLERDGVLEVKQKTRKYKITRL